MARVAAATATDRTDLRLVVDNENPQPRRAVRYQVIWFDAAEKRLLLEERKNARFFRDVEDWEIRETISFRDFSDCIQFAQAQIAEDANGQVRIERHLRVRSTVVGERWETDAIWLIDDEAMTPKEELPDERPDIDLDDDDEIID